jgi:magnesium transporter
MIVAFACSDQALNRLADTSVEALSRALWIDLLDATPDEIGRVQQATGLAVPTEAAVSEIETSSRLVSRDGAMYLSMPLIKLSDDGPRGVSAGFILSQERLVTIRFAASRIFETYADQLPGGSNTNDTGAHVFVGLMEAIVDRQADALEQVSADLDTLSHGIFAVGVSQEGGRKTEDAALRHTLRRLGHLGDLISHVRETQVGAARIVPYVATMSTEWLPKGLKPRLATLRRDIASVSDFDTHLNNKLQFLLDATLGFINIAQNNEGDGNCFGGRYSPGTGGRHLRHEFQEHSRTGLGFWLCLGLGPDHSDHDNSVGGVPVVQVDLSSVSDCNTGLVSCRVDRPRPACSSAFPIASQTVQTAANWVFIPSLLATLPRNRNDPDQVGARSPSPFRFDTTDSRTNTATPQTMAASATLKTYHEKSPHGVWMWA